LASLALAEEIVLKTNKGNVRGRRVDTDQGDYYYSFRGIRYAQAPVGKLRFMDPVEVEPYAEEFDATEDGMNCPQWMVGAGEVMGVGHGDDLQYMFSDVYGPDYTLSKSDRKFSKNIFVPLLTNFAKTSNPTPALTDAITVKWEPLTVEKNQIYRISKKLSMDTEHQLDSIKFWKEDIPKLFKKKEKAKKKEEL